MTTITRTFRGSRHTGYVVTNDAGAEALVYESKRRGYFVRTPATLSAVPTLIAARDLAVDLVTL